MPSECIIGERTTHRFGYSQTYVPGMGTVGTHRKVMADIHGWEAIKGKVVMHECDNPSCINPDHLRIGTQQENIQDCVIRKRHRGGHDGLPGERHPRTHLWDGAVHLIKHKARQGYTAAELGEEFGMARTSIQHILSGKNWSHVA